MIAPKIVSYVQPTGRDYSGTTSPDLITEVPGSEVLSDGSAYVTLEHRSVWGALKAANHLAAVVGNALGARAIIGADRMNAVRDALSDYRKVSR